MSTPVDQILCETDLQVPLLQPLAGGCVAAYTCGCQRKPGPNEDSILVASIGPSAAILVVADGMGGEVAGGKASALAVSTIHESVLTADISRGDLRPAILDGIERANQRILDLGVGAATTVAAVEINGDTVRPYHVGDSTILLISNRGRVKFETIPHSPVGHAVEAGVLDEEQAMRHAERHIVTNYLGSETMRIEIGPALRMAPRDTLIVASDGLSDNLTVPEITAIMRGGDLLRQTTTLKEGVEERMAQFGVTDLPAKPDDLSIIAYRRFGCRLPDAQNRTSSEAAD